MQKKIVLLVAVLALAGCSEEKPVKVPAAAKQTAQKFLGAIANKSATDYCDTFLPSTRYGTVMGHEQDLCLQLAQAWFAGNPDDDQVIDSGEIKLAKDYLRWLNKARVEVLPRGRVIYHFPNGGQLVLEQEQVVDPQSKATTWKVDVDASGFTGP